MKVIVNYFLKNMKYLNTLEKTSGTKMYLSVDALQYIKTMFSILMLIIIDYIVIR